ncbi:M50 family metallopeptidase [Acidobacteria bacterium AH-259-O06]|nr:M50 family metallopeptidase [Acidobacteria bacterium AH-259-O06]
MTPATAPTSAGCLNLRRLCWFTFIALASVFLWLTPALYPLKIFVVFIHETGHALAAVLTGGSVLTMVVTPWESGYVQHVGGNALLVASAGYVGSALFGGSMLLLSGRQRWAGRTFAVLSGLFAVVTLCFVRNLFGIVFGLGTAVVFGLLAWKQLRGMHYIIDVLAVMSSLYALYDLSDFLLIGAKTDAVILAEITPVPAFTWAILWSGLSLLVVYAAGKRALLRR